MTEDNRPAAGQPEPQRETSAPHTAGAQGEAASPHGFAGEGVEWEAASRPAAQAGPGGGAQPATQEGAWAPGAPQSNAGEEARPAASRGEPGVGAQGEWGQPAASRGEPGEQVQAAPPQGEPGVGAQGEWAQPVASQAESGAGAQGDWAQAAASQGEDGPAVSQSEPGGQAEWAARPTASPGDGGARSEWAAAGQPSAQGEPGAGWATGPQSGWARPAEAGYPPPQQGQWAANPAGERVLFGSAVGGPTPPAGNYLPNPNPPSRPQREEQPPQQRRGGGALVAGVAVLALLVGGGAGALGGYLVADSTTNAPVTNALDQKPPAQETSSSPDGSVEAVAEKVLPSVVQLRVQGRSSAGEGSGFVISSDGLVLTNNHVVEVAADGGRIEAVFQDGTTATATIVGRDPTSDVAVVKVEGKTGLPVVELGSSDALKVGQGVVAIGSPFELSGTVTSGIVSSLHRPTRAGGEDGSQATVLDAIQTDAAINPGNSGGPLVNMSGQIVGINSAIYSPQSATGQGGSVGIGFAIPMDQARRTADEIVKTGKATQTVLGVSVRDNPEGGALIADVVPDSAGEKAGLKKGDVVTKLDERRIDTSDALVAAVRSHAPGDKVRLELDNGSRTVEATLAGQTVEPQ